MKCCSCCCGRTKDPHQYRWTMFLLMSAAVTVIGTIFFIFVSGYYDSYFNDHIGNLFLIVCCLIVYVIFAVFLAIFRDVIVANERISSRNDLSAESAISLRAKRNGSTVIANQYAIRTFSSGKKSRNNRTKQLQNNLSLSKPTNPRLQDAFATDWPSSVVEYQLKKWQQELLYDHI